MSGACRVADWLSRCQRGVDCMPGSTYRVSWRVIEIYYISFFSALIDSIGYDPQCARLEVRLSRDRRVKQYEDVPEEIWYGFRKSAHPDMYYRSHICGCYKEMDISGAYGPEAGRGQTERP